MLSYATKFNINYNRQQVPRIFRLRLKRELVFINWFSAREEIPEKALRWGTLAKHISPPETNLPMELLFNCKLVCYRNYILLPLSNGKRLPIKKKLMRFGYAYNFESYCTMNLLAKLTILYIYCIDVRFRLRLVNHNIK
jgi:hypothetical protein